MYSSTPQTIRSPHLVAGTPTPRNAPSASDRTPADSSASQAQLEGLENAGRLVQHHLKEDASFVELSGQLRIATHCKDAYKRGQSLKGLQLQAMPMWWWCALIGVTPLQCKLTAADLQI